jgi:predicted RND superfamily exporter protein
MQKKLSKISHGLKKIPEGIVKLRWVFLVLFVALSIFGAVMIPHTKINYDLTGYLPAHCDSSTALELLKKEFDDKGMAYVMVKDVTPEKAGEIKTRLEKVEGVATVTYVESMNYKNNSALYTVMLKDYDSTAGAFDAVKDVIDALSDEKAYLSGQSAFSYYTKFETEQSIMKLGIAIVVIILLVMLFTSKTYFELIVLILVFGAAMAINMGTNFLFVNGISYIANLVALVLQLALSLDYSIILLHRYMEERDNGEDAKTATVTALTKGLPEILSSSLTTVAGLAALMLMTLSIGAEIGLSLAKGIVVSMATVIFFMPALLVIFDKPIQKTRHKSFVPNVTKPARAIVKARKVIVPAFLLIAILAGVAQGFNKYSFNYNSGSLIVAPKKVIEETGFGTLNSLVVVVPKGDAEKERQLVKYVESFDLIDKSQTTALATINVYSFVDPNTTEKLYLTDEVSKKDIGNLIDKIPSDAGVNPLIIKPIIEGWFDDYVKNYLPEGTKPSKAKVRLIDLLDFAVREKFDAISRFIGDDPEKLAYLEQIKQISFAKANLESENYSRITFNINGGVEDDDVFELVKTLKSGVSDFYEERYITGESVVCYEMSEYFMKDNLMVCLFTDLFILVILLITFRNISLPIILILAIQGGIFINFAIPFLSKTSISFIGYLIISAIQMGATIDYAIVLTNRYRGIRKDFTDRYDAMAAATNAVFPTILTSGVILTATGFVMSMLSSGVVAQLGLLLGVGTLTSIIIVLFVLPSLLLVTEKVVDKTDFSKLFRRKQKAAVEEVTLSSDFTEPSDNAVKAQKTENEQG